MEEIYELKPTAKIRTAYGDFYKSMQDEGIVKFQYDLFTYAFLVGIQDGNKGILPTKNKDICDVSNINSDSLKIIKGISLAKLDVDNGEQLLKEIMDYADRGIQIIQKEYEETESINLDKYLD